MKGESKPVPLETGSESARSFSELQSAGSQEPQDTRGPKMTYQEVAVALKGLSGSIESRNSAKKWRKYIPGAVLVFTFFCGMFTQYQSVAACTFLFHAGFLCYLYLVPNGWLQFGGTIFVGIGLALSMSQIFREDGGPSWDWMSFGIVCALQVGAAIVYLMSARVHFRLSSRFFNSAALFCYPVLVTSAYSIIALYSPLGSQGSMAYAMGEWLSFAQFASVFGITGLDLIILIVATCMAHAGLIDKRSNKRRATVAFSVGLAVFLLTWLFGSFRLVVPNLYQESVEDSATPASAWLNAVCIIQDGEADMLAMTNSILTHDPDVRFVVWSELAGNMYTSSSVSAFYTAVASMATAHNVVLGVTYGVWATSDPSSSLQYNMLSFADPTNGILFNYTKRYPVPVMEASVVAGNNPVAYGETALLGPLNAAICFDLDHPEYIRSGVSTGLLIQTANTWGIVGKYHAISSSFRAIENGMFLIRCGSNGPSGVWDPYGSTLAYQIRKDTDAVHFEVPVNPPRIWTFYSHVGFVIDYVLYGVSAIYLTLFAITFSRSRSFMGLKRPGDKLSPRSNST